MSRSLKKQNVITAVVLLFFLWFTELHSVLYKFWPERMNKISDSFLQPGYHRYDISMSWIVKTFFDDFMQIIGFFIAGSYIQKSNQKMGIIFKMFSMYFMFDLFLFKWNYKSNSVSFYSLLVMTTFIIFYLLKSSKHIKETGTLIDMNDN